MTQGVRVDRINPKRTLIVCAGFVVGLFFCAKIKILEWERSEAKLTLQNLFESERSDRLL
jgi:hypothetical protein